MRIPSFVRRFLDSNATRVSNPRGKVLRLLGALALLLVALLLGYSELFGPPHRDDQELFEFIVTPEAAEGDIAAFLEEAGIVRHAVAFRIANTGAERGVVRPGGYRISLSQDAWTVADTLSKAPYLAWVTIPEGYRKEQIAEMLSETLAWSPEEVALWSAASSGGLREGFYFPDTYLIPSDQTPEQITERFRGRFEDAYAPYAAEAAELGMDWTEVVTLASLIEREAAKNDKELVAGILLNRLERGMLLQVDATLQYIRGAPGKWWPVPRSQDKYLESPFNTYRHVGLPPQPIANPSLNSIVAVLRADETSCLYYLHDAKGRIHCSPNYQGHVDNINIYLR